MLLLLIDGKMLFRDYPRIEMTMGKQNFNVNFKCTYEKVDRKNSIGVHALSRTIRQNKCCLLQIIFINGMPNNYKIRAVDAEIGTSVAKADVSQWLIEWKPYNVSTV